MNFKQTTCLSIILFLSISQLCAQQSLQKTTWEGKLGNIRIILKVSTDSLSKKQIAEYDSPDQGALGLKVSDLQITADSLSAYSATIGGGFKGKFNADKTELTGKWKQGGGELATVLKRADNKPDVKRPQTPKPPFPYNEEKVIYYNKDKSIQYGATLTLPKSNKPLPVVILITGSGQEDRDETIFGHKLFWILADYLSRNGIAVLRVDDRGVGQSTGEVYNATSMNFANDVLVGVNYLKNDKRIDATKIGLIGHSEGGIIAPLVAIKSKDIAFIVSMAGVGTKSIDLIKKQQQNAYKKLGFNEDELKRMGSLTDLMFNLVNKYPNNDKLKEMFADSFEAWRKQQPESFLLKAKLKGLGSDETISTMAAIFFSPWMRYLLQYDPSTVLTQIKIPVLALNGGKDMQVSAKENLAGFNKYLTQAGNKNFKTVLFPNLNHLFQTANTGDVNEYYTIEETMAPEALNAIKAWIIKTVQ